MGLERWETAFFQLLELLLVILVDSLRKQPFYQVQRFLSFYDLVNGWLVWGITNLFVSLAWLSFLAFLVFTLVYDIFEDVDISSLKFLVFNNSTREKNIETRIFSLMQI